MKKIIMIVLLLFVSSSVRAVETAERPFSLQGKVGLGLDHITGASTDFFSLEYFGEPNALSLRYWVTEKLCWEGLLALNVTSSPGGETNADNTGTSTNFGGGLGTSFRYNFRQPVRGVFIQWIGRATLGVLGQTVNNGEEEIATLTTNFSLFAGLGFEAFLPVWEALSVEGNVGLAVNSSQVQGAGLPGGQSSSSFAITGTGYLPLNLSVHYYF